MKELIRSVCRRFRFEIVRYRPVPKSKRTEALTCYDTATGRYYLPTDAPSDIIARATGFDEAISTSPASTSNPMPIVFEYDFDCEDEYRLSFQEYVDFVRDIGYRFEKVIDGYNYLVVPA